MQKCEKKEKRERKKIQKSKIQNSKKSKSSCYSIASTSRCVGIQYCTHVFLKLLKLKNVHWCSIWWVGVGIPYDAFQLLFHIPLLR